MLKQNERELTPQGHRILIVDDDPLVCKITRELIFRNTPHNPDTANDGIDALDKHKKASNTGQGYDLMLVDLMMPEMDGTTLISEIREYDQDIAIIVITGRGELSEAYRLLKEFQISDFLYKPVNSTDALLFSIENALEKSRLRLEIQQHEKLLEERVLERTNALRNEVAEHKQSEEKLDHANHELKETQAQLVQAAKLASIGELATGIAHELNTPLMIIRGNSQLILENATESLVPQEILQSISQFVEQTDRMGRIINWLRNFSNQTLFESIPIRVNDALDSLIPVSEQFRQRGIQIEKNYDSSHFFVLGNLSELEQAFIHLLTNARDALEGIEHPTLKIQTEIQSQKQQEDTVVIRFIDNGHGIPQDVIANVFDPFFTTKEVGKGTGLGLSVCYGIVKKHHGHIEVSSLRDSIDLSDQGHGGTTVTISLPILQKFESENLEILI